MSSNKVFLRNLLVETKDGEWGKDSPFDGSVEMHVIRGTDFDSAKNGVLTGVPLRQIAGKAAARKSLQPGDILIETAGGSKGRPTGKTVYLRPTLFGNARAPITCASFARFMRVDSAVVEPEFLYWYLQFLYASGVIENHQVQHTGIARFQFTKFADTTEIHLPRRGEQQGISACLGALDERITLLRETNATLEAIAQALFKSWFVDFDPVRAKQEGRVPEGMDRATAALFPDAFDESEFGIVPSGWRIGYVAELGDVICGKTPPTSDSENYGVDVPFITIPDMHGLLAVTSTARALSRKGADGQAKKYLPAGSICVSCIATPGLVVLVTEPSQTNQQINSVVPDQKWGRSFPLFLLRRIGDKVRSGGSGGSVFHNLSKSGFEKIRELLPSEAVALAFGEIIDPLVEKIIDNQWQTETLASLRDTLLPRLISGQLRLSEAEALVA
jgi:type I restriction enzyme S subunit